MAEQYLLTADDIMNTFCAIAGITTVRYDFFGQYKNEKATKNLSGKRQVVDIVKSTRWFQDNYGHNFSIIELPEILQEYAKQNSIELQADSQVSPLAQIETHVYRKNPQLDTRPKSVVTEATTSSVVNKVAGSFDLRWPQLAEGRETQRASNFSGLQAALALSTLR